MSLELPLPLPLPPLELFSLLPSPLTLVDLTAFRVWWLINSTPALAVYCFFLVCASTDGPPLDPKKKKRRRQRINRLMYKKWRFVVRLYLLRVKMYDENLLEMYNSGVRINNLPSNFHQWDQLYSNWWQEKKWYAYPKRNH